MKAMKKGNNNDKSKLTRFRLFLLYTFPLALFCSYFPIFPIASTDSTNYEFSLALVWLFIFSILSIKDFVKHISSIYKTPSRILFYLFPTYALLSSLWSTNPLRAILTSGILWCLIISSVAILSSLKVAISRNKFLKSFLIASVVFCFICWLQSILDVVGVSRDITLLCSGCTSYMFGFPHPSGFSIEPQFMGNLLLAPTFLGLYLWTKPNNDIKRTKSQITEQGNNKFYIIKRIKTHKYALLSFLFASTLFLTFSRGAIYAFIAGFIFVFVLQMFKYKNSKFWKTLPLLIASGAFVVLMQGAFSALSPTNSTFLEGVEKSISQMTLGKINLNFESKESPESESATNTDMASPVFDGYVEESTNARMKFNRIAIELAPKSTRTLLLGYGLGSAGEVMYKEGKTDTPYEIVQNEFLSLLLETGIVGVLLALLSLISCLVRLLAIKNCPERSLLGAIILSYLVSLLFFSGLPNALHIYLFPAFLFAILLIPPRHRHFSQNHS